MFNAVSPYY